MAIINSITVGDDTYAIGGWGEPGITGYTPIGSIIAVMANTAPTHYLACDGATYNIADYVELSNFFEDQFGSKNYFGGDGETTFAVPDLRGEFLRGAGTNSHANQGSGANVGVHQNSTEINIGWFNNASGGFSFSESTSATYVSLAKNADYSHNYGIRQSYIVDTDLKRVANTASNAYMSCIRPTNTSVLFCIATKNIYTNPENSYSTDEKAVGRWVDESLIYQKTFITTNIPNNNQVIISHEIENLGIVIQVSGMLKAKSGYFTPLPCVQDNATTANIGVDITSSSIIIKSRTFDAASIFDTAYITIQYTKTSESNSE